MITAFRFLLILSVPMMAVLSAGLFLVMRTGQADPWLWSGPALMFLAVAGFFTGWRAALVNAFGALLCVLLFCFFAAGRGPGGSAALGLLAICLLSAVGGAMLRPSASRIAAGIMLASAALLSWLGPHDRVVASAVRPSLAVMTALPLFWEEGRMTRANAPIVTVLRKHFNVRAVDHPADLGMNDRLLLAQPRDPGPEGLFRFDSWLRGGGRALILADPQLVWSFRLPLGDRRRAPRFTTLGPLLAHWGVALKSVEEGEVRHFLREGRLVTTVAAGRLRATGPACRVIDDGLVMRCAFGRGEAIILADADLLDDRLWLADPARPLERRAWTADTPDLIAEWLGLPTQAERRWLRDAASLGAAVRWALLLGIGWVVMGMAFCGWQRRTSGRLYTPSVD